MNSDKILEIDPADQILYDLDNKYSRCQYCNANIHIENIKLFMYEIKKKTIDNTCAICHAKKMKYDLLICIHWYKVPFALLLICYSPGYEIKANKEKFEITIESTYQIMKNRIKNE